MSVEDTLARIVEDLAEGRPTLARQRLKGLVGSLPQRLDLREQLAELYRNEGDRTQAGRWSYLAEVRDHGEIDAFERAHESDPIRMMRALGWRGPEERAATKTAQDRLRALRVRAEAGFGLPIEWDKQHNAPQPPPGVGERIVEIGCVLVVLVLLVLVVSGVFSAAAAGLHTVMDWVT